jgi:RHS repeat-associated protein
MGLHRMARAVARRWLTAVAFTEPARTACAVVLAAGAAFATPVWACQSAQITAPGTFKVVLPAPASTTVTVQTVPGKDLDSGGGYVNRVLTKLELFKDGALFATNTFTGQGTNGNFAVSNLPVGSYNFKARASCLGVDSAGQPRITTADTQTLIIVSNVPPVVAMTSPAAGSTFAAPATIPLAASVSDPGDTITRVEYYSGSTLIVTLTTAPYSYSWTGRGVGSYSVTVRATDSNGVTSTSSPVNFSVVSNQPPAVSIASPASGSRYDPPATISLTANASDTDGSVSTVEYFQGSTKIGNGAGSNWAFNWGGVPVGTYSVTARATDNGGAVTVSAPVAVNVGYATPSVALQSPTPGSVYLQGTEILLAATASTPSGTIQRVTFYDSDRPIGTGFLTGSTYQLRWNGAVPGGYAITARALDSRGIEGASAVASITVLSTGGGILPPNATGATAGSLTGSAAVSSTGAATYAVPIPLPPGTAGHAPALALQYSSQAGTSVIGWGWGLSGLSSITRCGANVAQDGAGMAKGVTLTATDEFCLDGQRLIRVSGTHGATAEYRTEVDGFSRILSFGSDVNKGPDRWEVWTKGGQRLHYGNTADSSVEAQGRSPAVILTWAVAGVFDGRGNYWSVAYDKNAAEGEHYPRQILYTGNAAQGRAPYNAVRFMYDATRPDPYIGYVMGSKVSVLRRLNAVQTLVNVGANGSGGTLARDIRIVYSANAASGRSLVSTISDCDGLGACLPATEFGWVQRTAADGHFNGPGSGSWGGPASNIQAGQGTDSSQVLGQTKAGDFNGDGQTDLLVSTGNGSWNLCLSTGTGFNCQNWSGPAKSSMSVLTGDFDGDGRTDLMFSASATVMHVCLTRAAGFECSSWAGENAGLVLKDYIIGDFNGDGRDDYAAGYRTATSTWDRLCTSTGSGFSCIPYANVAFIVQPPSVDGQPAPIYYSPLVQDVDGDGKADVIRFGVYGSTSIPQFVIYLSRPTGFEPVADIVGGNGFAFPVAGGSWFAEHNGDPYESYPDWLLGRGSAGMRYCRWTGQAISCNDLTGMAPTDAIGDHFGDMDGDGRPDGLQWNATRGTWRVCQLGNVPTAGGHFSCADWAGPNPSGYVARMLGDFNGDGRPDIALYDKPNNRWVIQLAGGPKADLLTSVTDGSGLATRFTYKPLADGSVYTSDRNDATHRAVYPQRDVQDSTHVVSRLQLDGAESGILATDYRYGGLKIDLQGRGILGFRWMEAYDAATRVTARTEHYQAYPFTGMVKTALARHANGVELRRTDNTVSALASATAAAAASSIRYPYVSQSTDTTREMNTGAIATTASATIPASGGLDSYGNVLSTTINITGGGETWTTASAHTYDNLTASWQLGLLRTSTVTKSSTGTPNPGSVTRQIGIDYDASGQVLREIVEPNDAAMRVTTTYGRDGYGNITTRTLAWIDPATGTAQTRQIEAYTYDAKGRFPEGTRNALNHTETRSFDDKSGNPLTLTGPNNLTTNWAYDGWGRKLREARADGTATTWTYKQCVDTCWNGAKNVLITQSWAGANQSGVPTEAFADRFGRSVLTRTWSFTGTQILAERRYDSRGRLERASRPFSTGTPQVWASYVYDDLGRITQTAEPTASNGIQYSGVAYNGLTTTFINAKAQTRVEVKNALGKTRKITDAAGYDTSYQYEPFGNLVKTVDAKLNAIEITYDKLGRKTRLKDPDLGTWNYAVDPLGQTTRQTDAKNQVTTYMYDALGRSTQRLEPDLDSRWIYDTATTGIGKLAEAYTRRGDGSKDYRRVHAYDNLGRPFTVTTTTDWDYRTSTLYDEAGRVASLRHSRNTVGGTGGPANTVEFVYNPHGYLYQIKTARVGGASKIEWQVNAQDAEQRVTQEQFGSGLLTNRDFNRYTGRLQRISTGQSIDSQTANAAGLQNDNYLYDAIGNLEYRSNLVSANGAWLQENFTYDALNRLRTSRVMGKGEKTVNYDSIGNITGKTLNGSVHASYAYPASGQGVHAVSSVSSTMYGTRPYSYDANGNLVNGGGYIVVPTSFNLPASITYDRSGNLWAQYRDTFVYGPEHQRAKQTLAVTSGTGPVAATTIFYAGAMEKEVTSSGTKIKTYLPRGIGYLEESLPSGASATQSATPQARYFHHDHVGSVILITDESKAEVQRSAYDAWGRRRDLNGNDDTQNQIVGTADRTGFTGQEQLDALNLVHMNGRLYDPLLGRFTSADPTVPDPSNPQALNRYSYTYNNPLAYADPSGFTPLPVFETLPFGGMVNSWMFTPGTMGGAGRHSLFLAFQETPPTMLEPVNVIGRTERLPAGPRSGRMGGTNPRLGYAENLLARGKLIMLRAGPVVGRAALAGAARGAVAGAAAEAVPGAGQAAHALLIVAGVAWAIAENGDQLLAIVSESADADQGQDGASATEAQSAGANSAASSPPPDDDDPKRNLTKEEKKAIKSYEKRITEHEQKLAEFKENPSVRPGMEGQPHEVIERQQAARIQHLETEIRTFRANIDKIMNGK